MNRKLDGLLKRMARVDIGDKNSLEAIDDMTEAAAALRAQQERIDALEAVVREGRRAIGEHWAPNDCYATGPMTGDAIHDLVQCPACSFIALHDATLTGEKT